MRNRSWRIGADRRATTALEFALVGPMFLLLALMIIENGLMFFAQTVLDNATRAAARQLQIGAVTTSAAFQAALCGQVGTLINCSGLQFTVTSGAAFPTAVTAPTATGTFTNASFAPGTGGQFVLVEVAYNRSYVTPWLINIGPASWVLLSTHALQNEPFS